MFTTKLIPLLLILLLCSCGGSKSHIVSTQETDPIKRLSMDDLGFIDKRSRFRDIFCAVTKHHGIELPNYDSCNNALVSVGLESEHKTYPIKLKRSKNDFIIGLVPGIAWQCVKNWLEDDHTSTEHLLSQGYDVRLFEVDGLSGHDNNAQQISDHISGLPKKDQKRPIILIGYSKGAVDVLQAVTTQEKLKERVVAVVSVAGAVGGSPLANSAKQAHLNLLKYIPMSGCETGDNKAIETLHTETRKTWLEDSILPDNLKYYSVISYPDEDKISLGLKLTHNKLADIDSRNDGQIIFYHQLIPNSSLLAFVNADHWAMSIPVARQSFLNRISFANKNEYPREVLLESILRYVEEDLLKH